jgi:hypothetical protein
MEWSTSQELYWFFINAITKKNTSKTKDYSNWLMIFLKPELLGNYGYIYVKDRRFGASALSNNGRKSLESRHDKAETKF